MKPLCGSCEDGWIVDEDMRPVERCPCRYRDLTPQDRRDQGMAATVDANPHAMRAALTIIRETALTMPVFSSNDTRARMKIAQVPGEVIGSAFRQAAKDRVIRRTGYVESTDLGTHSHPVAEWQSLIFRSAS